MKTILLIRTRGRARFVEALSLKVAVSYSNLFNKIYLILSKNDPDIPKYKALADKYNTHKVQAVVSPATNLAEKNNFIYENYCDKDTHTVVIDDDITHFSQFSFLKRKLKETPATIDFFKKALFMAQSACKNHNCRFWALSSTPGRAFILKEKDTKLKYSYCFFLAPGALYGIVGGAKGIKSSISFQEDRERGVQFMIEDGGIVKINGLRFNSTNLLAKEAGGINTNTENKDTQSFAVSRFREHEKAVAQIQKKYPLFLINKVINSKSNSSEWLKMKKNDNQIRPACKKLLGQPSATLKKWNEYYKNNLKATS